MYSSFLLGCLVIQATVAASLDRKQDLSRKEDEGNVAGTMDPYTKMMAAAWSYEYSIQTGFCNDTEVCEVFAGNNKAESYLTYSSVDFQNGARGFSMVVALKPEAGVRETGTVYLHIDQPYYPPFAEVFIGDTGGEQNWFEVNQLIEDSPTGVHSMYLTFGTENNVNVGNLASFTFYKKM